MNTTDYAQRLSSALNEVRDAIPEQPTGNVELRVTDLGFDGGSQTRTVAAGATREEFEANAVLVFDQDIDDGRVNSSTVTQAASDLWTDWEDTATKDRDAVLVARDSLVSGRLMGYVSKRSLALVKQTLVCVDFGFLRWVDDCSHDVYASLCDALTAAEERLAELADAPTDPKGLMGVSA